ncbi:hypothetical protein ANCDUO_05303 [Ancylostoma duodenale]|uniref:Uncharacterized protein n=1 Tax=Ancylostoma duodenale TaxID=51022 RepID=A0A0C2DP00_9BILA|nr:hypothetical protein ANCDUO_05303 [Ancylostoma duodenale]
MDCEKLSGLHLGGPESSTALPLAITCAKPHSTVEALEKDLTKAWSNLPMDIIARAVEDFPRRLGKYIEASSGHFEQH